MTSTSTRKGTAKPTPAKRTAKAKPKNKGGRPRVLTEDDYQQVLEGLMDGLSLRKVCKRPGLPSVKSVLQRVVRERRTVAGFGEQYAQAREVGLLRMEEELVEIADNAGLDESDPKLANAAVQRARIQVETRKWVMSKQLPRRYGERVALAGADDAPAISISSDDAAREVALLLAGAASRKVTAERKAQAESNGHD